MTEFANFSLELPHVDAWPFRQVKSSNGIQYYQCVEEVALPEYSDKYWRLFTERNIAVATFLWNAGCHCIPCPANTVTDKQKLQSDWNFIKVEERRIRKSGLDTQDIFSGETIKIKSTTYQCPWANIDEFEASLNQQAKTDRMYCLIPQELEALRNKMKETVGKIKNIEVRGIYDIIYAESGDGAEHSFALICIEVSAPADRARQEAWIQATKTLERLLRESGHGKQFQVPQVFAGPATAKSIGSDSENLVRDDINING